MTYDLIVMGGGLAGMAAANRAAESGLKVALLEQGGTDQYLCNSRMSGGILHVCFHDVKEPAQSLRDAIRTQTAGYADGQLAEALAVNAKRCVEWLSAQGVRFIRNPGVVWQQWVMAPPRSISPGPDWKGRGPDVMLRTLLTRLRARNAEVLLETKVVALLQKDGACVGVRAVSGGREVELQARAVVIADGGFQANLELLGQHIARNPAGILQRGAASGKGDGLRLALGMGAATTHLGSFYGHLLSRQALENPMLWPYPQLDELAVSGMLVDKTGTRVADEGRGGVYLANQVARRADPLDCVAIFDKKIWDVQGTQARIPANPHLLRAGAKMYSGDSVAALARELGIAPEALEKTVADYNQAINIGKGESLSPPRTAGAGAPCPIATAPFYALPVCGGITHTTGGLKVDADMRVLREDGQPIQGVFAAGSSVGGVEGGPDSTYVGGLMKALVFGLIAAESAGRQIRG